MSPHLILRDIVDRAMLSGQINTDDSASLLQIAKVLDYPLSPEDQQKVRWISDRIRMGFVKVIDS